MATEKKIKQVLDLLTTTPKAEVESLDASSRNHAVMMRQKIDLKNVVGVGISEKTTKGKATGKLSLTFYVEKKIDLKKLPGNQVIPPTVPETLSGKKAIPTDVVVLGKLIPEVNVTRKKIQPGYSIGHIKITAGTLGALVSDGKEHYLLSNSHVLARNGTAKKGDPIVYPGKADSGKSPADVLAHLYKFNKFVSGGDFINHADCAIAKPIKARLADLTSEIKGVGIPKGVIKPKRGMKVVKVGRTTGKTIGEVRDVHFRCVLKYDKGIGDVGFIDQVLCTRYTEPGDSGSLVLDRKTGRAVGLHFAGANGGSVFSPIEDVLNCLNVKLVTKAINNATKNKKPGKNG